MPPSVHARAILPIFAALSAIMAPARVALADDAAPPTHMRTNAATAEDRFRAFKSEGDRALAEKRLSDAIRAYDAALDAKYDPLIAGRMGLALIFAFDDPQAFVAAAPLLYEAVLNAAGATSQEKDAFWAGYKRTRTHVCKMDVFTNDANAQVDFGNGMKPRPTEFFTFVKKGKGEAIARLEGHEDIRKPFECTDGSTIQIRFEFPPLIPSEPKTITVIEPGKETIKIVHEPTTEQQPNPVNAPVAKNRNAIGVSFGPVAVFRAAPSISFGINAAANYSFGNYSAMIAARGAWSTSIVGSGSINSFVFVAMGGPCARWKWFDGCIALNVTALQYRRAENTIYFGHTESQMIPGFTAGLGVNRQISSALALRLSGDLSVLSDGLVISREMQGQVSRTWDGGRVLGGLAITAVFSP